MTLWFDVEDLITHFQHAFRPTGIQRLTIEIYREVWKAAAPGDVRFCRHGTNPADYYVVDWPGLEAAIQAASAASRSAPIASAPGASAAVSTASLPHAPAQPAPVALNMGGRIHHYLAPRIPPGVRLPLGIIYRAQRQTASALLALAKAVFGQLASRGEPAKLGDFTIQLSTKKAAFGQNDIFIALGASWGQFNPAAGPYLKKQYGLRHAVLMHDLIPELYPEWTSPDGLAAYRGWLRNVVPDADLIFSVSKNTAADLKRRMAQWNRQVPEPVVLPVGHLKVPEPVVLPVGHLKVHGDPQAAQPLQANPFGRPYILFVSTIEVRKNHALLFRVWRRLLETMPAEQVPCLVFAGKRAWLTGDFLTQVENTGWLDGHVKLVESPSESELAALYRGCEFTAFPSLYEGWGLPVTESLSFGKTVAASNRSAIPEAGGDFCCYFDPEDLNDAYTVIRGLIENPQRVAELEARIARDFRPPGWADTASVLLAHLRAAAHAPASQGYGSGANVSVADTLA